MSLVQIFFQDGVLPSALFQYIKCRWFKILVSKIDTKDLKVSIHYMSLVQLNKIVFKF